MHPLTWLVICAYVAMGCVLLIVPLKKAWTAKLSVYFYSADLYLVIFVSCLLWPLLLSPSARELLHKGISNLRIWRDARSRLKEGLSFSYMGGVGRIRCWECSFEQIIVSFTHGVADNGERNCDEGRQCLRCGKFDTIHGQGEPIRRDEKPCNCGGELSRDHKLFCPACRSQKLLYRMGYIT